MTDEPLQLTTDGRLVPHSQVVAEMQGDFSKTIPAQDYPGTWMPVSGTFRVYPLEPRMWDDGASAQLWYSKGHHDEQDFLTAVAKRTGYVPRGQARHEWWATRQGYGMTGYDGEYKFLMEPVEPTARGAYPVTVVEL